MKASDADRFKKVMYKLAIAYDQEITEEKLAVYWEVLLPWNIEIIEKATTRYLRGTGKESTFFPKPADLIRIIQGTSTNNASQAWGLVVKAMEKYGSWWSVQFDDPKIAECINIMGGWTEICKTTYDEMPFKEREFSRLYESFTHSGRLIENQVLEGNFAIGNTEKNQFSEPKRIAFNTKQLKGD